MKLVVLDTTGGAWATAKHLFSRSKKSRLLHTVFNELVKQPEINLVNSKVTLFVVIKALGHGTGGETKARPDLGGMVHTMLLASTVNYSKMIYAFSHEMVHVRQILTGQLVQHRKFISWEGEQISARNFNYAVEAASLGARTGLKILMNAYRSLPWEKEAHDLGPKLYKRVRDQIFEKAGLKLVDRPLSSETALKQEEVK